MILGAHKLHIAIINAVFPPEPVVSAQLGRDLAEYFAESGVRVTVLCPYPSRPHGVEYASYRPSAATRVDLDGRIAVVRLPSFTSPQSRLIARTWESFHFGWHVCRYLDGQLSHVDVIYVNSWPLISQALIARYCTRRGIPFVLHVQDIYPESLFGKIPRWSRNLVGLVLTAIDRWVALRAARVVVISENMRHAYIESRGLTPEKVITIMNWLDERRFDVLPARSEACAYYGITEDRFTFLYFGNIGPVAGVEDLIVAFHTAGLKQAQLIVAGSGSSKASCVALASRLGACNVRFVPVPYDGDVSLLQSLGHVCLLPMRQGAGMTSIPSKLLAYLFSAKPVLATLDTGCETARCIREAQCGWVGEPEGIVWLADKMRAIAAMPASELAEIGQRGKQYGLAHFSRTVGVSRLANTILNAA